MKKLVDGIQRFQRDTFPTSKELFTKLGGGQSPATLFITCSDSRIDPNMLTGAEPGELFIVRNAGNLVPAHAASDGGEAATIEYAVAALRVRDVIICGHSHCGAMKGLLQPELLAELPAFARWLRHAEATRRILMEADRDEELRVQDEATRLTLAIQENVLVQLENLQTHPAVAARLAQHDLQLHGWVYTIESGMVEAYDPDLGRFEPISQVPPPSVKPLERPVGHHSH